MEPWKHNGKGFRYRVFFKNTGDNEFGERVSVKSTIYGIFLYKTNDIYKYKCYSTPVFIELISTMTAQLLI